MSGIKTSEKQRQSALKRHNPNNESPASQKLANQCWGGFRKPAGERAITLYFDTAPAILLFPELDLEEYYFVDEFGFCPNRWLIRVKLDLGRKKFVTWLREEITNNNITKQYPKNLVDFWNATCNPSAFEFKFFNRDEESKLILD